MRILQICSARSIGGGERHVIDLSNSLTSRGHSVFAALVPGAAIATQLDVPRENIIERSLFGSVDVASAVAIGKFVRARRIELIHAHLGRDYPIAAMAARVSGVPHVITRHVLFPMRRLHRLVLSGVRGVIAPSNAVAKSLRAQQLFREEKIVTIRNGLDAASYKVRDPIARDEFVVGSVGNLDPVKGYDVLIRAAAEVIPAVPDARFVIAGVDGSTDKRNERDIRSLIAELGLEGRVELAGWSEDIRASLAGFDVFVSSSRSESFGYAIAEAMLTGLPVIATETEGAKEIIMEANGGMLVAVDDPSALAAALIDLANDRSKREMQGRAGRRFVESEFSLEIMVDQTEDLYSRILSATN